MRILITGGAGFIGSHTTEALLQAGMDVTVYDNLSTGSLANLQPFAHEVRFVKGDVRDLEALMDVSADADAILHLAALVSVPESVRYPHLAHEVNATATLNVLEAARARGIRRLVLASSAAVYGANIEVPLQEDVHLQPLSPYAAQKLLGELYGSVYAHLYDLCPIELRYFNVYGPRQDPASPYSGVLSRFIEAASHGREVTVYGDGEQTRDFVYVADVAQANLRALTAPEEVRDLAINVGTGQETSVREAYETIKRLAGSSLAPRFGPARDGDVRHSLANITRARTRLGYEPRYTFEAGIRLTIEWSLSRPYALDVPRPLA